MWPPLECLVVSGNGVGIADNLLPSENLVFKMVLCFCFVSLVFVLLFFGFCSYLVSDIDVYLI